MTQPSIESYNNSFTDNVHTSDSQYPPDGTDYRTLTDYRHKALPITNALKRT